MGIAQKLTPLIPVGHGANIDLDIHALVRKFGQGHTGRCWARLDKDAGKVKGCGFKAFDAITACVLATGLDLSGFLIALNPLNHRG